METIWITVSSPKDHIYGMGYAFVTVLMKIKASYQTIEMRSSTGQ